MADYYTSAYVKPQNGLENIPQYALVAHPAAIVGAGPRDGFISRHGDDCLKAYSGIGAKTLVLWLELSNNGKPPVKELAFFHDYSQIKRMLADMHVQTSRDLEGRTIHALFQFNNLVGIRTA